MVEALQPVWGGGWEAGMREMEEETQKEGRKKSSVGNLPPRLGVTLIGESLGKTQGQQKILWITGDNSSWHLLSFYCESDDRQPLYQCCISSNAHHFLGSEHVCSQRAAEALRPKDFH